MLPRASGRPSQTTGRQRNDPPSKLNRQQRDYGAPFPLTATSGFHANAVGKRDGPNGGGGGGGLCFAMIGDGAGGGLSWQDKSCSMQGEEHKLFHKCARSHAKHRWKQGTRRRGIFAENAEWKRER